MCVIIHKPVGVEVDTDILRLSHNANTHGAGYMLSTPDGRVYFAKGFINDTKMVEFLDQMCTEVGVPSVDMEIVFHFRISTAGNINAMNCHPFVVDKKAIYKTQGKVDNRWVLMHNGHHSLFPTIFGIDRDELAIYSDTFLMVRDGLAQVSTKIRKNIIEDFSKRGQKYAIMYPNGSVKRYGSWSFDEDSGCYFSNMYWKPYTRTEIVSRTSPRSYVPTTSGLQGELMRDPNSDYVYDDEYKVYYKVPKVDGDIPPWDMPDPDCPHSVVNIDDGDGYMYCEDCGGNMTLHCNHPTVSEGGEMKGYCVICGEHVGLANSDPDKCGHPDTSIVYDTAEDGRRIRAEECDCCGDWLSTRWLDPRYEVQDVDWETGEVLSKGE